MVNVLVYAGFESYTSANMKKSLLPIAFACAITAGENFCQNCTSTCFTVSMRNPSTPMSTHLL